MSPEFESTITYWWREANNNDLPWASVRHYLHGALLGVIYTTGPSEITRDLDFLHTLVIFREQGG